MPLIDADQYDEVRAAIDVSLTSAQVPDSIIGMSVYQGLAERDVIRSYPNAVADMSDTDLAPHIMRATIFLTASYLAPQIPYVLKENFGNYSYTRKDADLIALADSLRGLAENELAILNNEDLDYSPVPVMFTLAKATRGYGRW